MKEILLIGGRPGSGKSTIARELRNDDSTIEHLSIGDRLRLIGRGVIESTHSQQVIESNDTLSESKRLDDSIVSSVVFEFIEQTKPTTSLVIVDGYPRFKDQVDHFFRSLNESDSKLLGVMNILVDYETALNRIMSRGDRGGERSASYEFADSRIRQHDMCYGDTVESMSQLTSVIDIQSQADEHTTVSLARDALESLRATRL